ncbi:MAG: hypothetical protein ACERKX_13930 [Anaerolineales bacterium]
MPTFISPIHTAEEFQDHWNLDDKIEIFIARVEGWQLDVALELLQKDVSNCDVAVLMILLGFFEMIGKYSHGYLGTRDSEKYFKLCLLQVFPKIPARDQKLLKTLYSDVRCGLFHITRPGSNVIIQRSAPGSIGYNEEHGLLMISPSILANDLKIFFSAFAEALRDPGNTSLRENFEKRFDLDNNSPITSAKRLARSDLGCGAICCESCMMGMLEKPAMD